MCENLMISGSYRKSHYQAATSFWHILPLEPLLELHRALNHLYLISLWWLRWKVLACWLNFSFWTYLFTWYNLQLLQNLKNHCKSQVAFHQLALSCTELCSIKPLQGSAYLLDLPIPIPKRHELNFLYPLPDYRFDNPYFFDF